MTRSIVRIFFVLLCPAIMATGCKPAGEMLQAANAKRSQSDPVSVMVDSVNYSHERGMNYTLYDLAQERPQAVGGAIVTMLATGGEKGCCLSLPVAWKPGLKVRVQWHESDFKQIYPENYVRELEIPRYDTPADLFVVFYPDHEVEVVVSAAEPGHPDWLGKIKQTPWEACLATHGKKPCKAALPKLFDTASGQGFCTYIKEEWAGDKEKELSCESAMIRCMRDYEDEPFCKNILWGARKK